MEAKAMAAKAANFFGSIFSRELWASIFGWKAIFRWDVLGAIVPGVFLAGAFGMMGIDWFPHNLLISQVCLGICGVLCVAKTIGHAAQHGNSTPSHKAVFCVVICTVILSFDVFFIAAIQQHKTKLEIGKGEREPQQLQSQQSQPKNEPTPTVSTAQTPKPQSAQPTVEPQSPSRANVIPPPEAKLLMSKAYILPAKKKKTGMHSFIVNFFYANRGSMPTTGQDHDSIVAVSDHLFSREEIVSEMRQVSSFKALPELRKGGDEIYPNDPNERFFSMPDVDDKIDQLAPFFDDVMNGKKRVYFFVTIKFRDGSMKPSVVGVSETCGWFLKDLNVVHNCGVDGLYSEIER